MLLSIGSFSSTSMVTSYGLSQYRITIYIGLIILLSLKEVLCKYEPSGENIKESLNIAIIPLILSFILYILSFLWSFYVTKYI